MRRLIQFVAISSMVFMLPATLTADQVPWITDLDEAFEIAKQQNRPLLLHFWSPDCIPCLQLEETVFSKPSVTRTLGELFVPVKINAKDDPRTAAKYEIRSVPWDVILTPGGDELHRMLSSQDPNRYVAQLSAAAFRMGVAQSRRKPSRSGPPERQGPHSSASYNSPLGPPPGGSPWASSSPSSTLANDDIGPIGHESRPRQERPAAEPMGEPEEVINRFAQRNSPAERSAPTERSAAASVPESRQNDPRGQWGAWPGRATGGAPGSAPGNAPAGNARIGSAPVVAERRSTVLPESTSHETATVNNRFADPSEPVRSPRRARPAGPTRTARMPIGLDGFCPVTLLKKDIWKKGDPRFGVVHRGRTYLFSGPGEKAEFLKDPDGYSPVLAGIDPVLLADSGDAVEGLRAFGIVYRDRVFLFTSEENLQRFWQQPKKYAAPIRQAMENGTVDRLFR